MFPSMHKRIRAVCLGAGAQPARPHTPITTTLQNNHMQSFNSMYKWVQTVLFKLKTSHSGIQLKILGKALNGRHLPG